MSEPRPIGEVLLEFAALDEAGMQWLDPDELDSRVQLAALVWNAVLLAGAEEAEARARGDESASVVFERVIAGLIADTRAGIGGGNDSFETTARYLVVRKLEQFADDTRAISDVAIARDERGRASLVATAL